MNAPADSSIPMNILFIDHNFFIFSIVFLFIIDNCNYGKLFSLNNEYGYKNEYFYSFDNNLSKN